MVKKILVGMLGVLLCAGVVWAYTVQGDLDVTGEATIGTQIVVPTVVGGSSTTSDLNLKTTSGVGTTGADMHFLVGNNGATEAMTILNSGNVGIGTTSPGAKLEVAGQVKITGGSPGANKVLTSDANGLASWSTLGSGSISDIYLFNTGDTGTGAYTFSGGAFSINASSNYATNINTGTSTGAVTIGGGSGTLAIASTGLDVSTAGALSGITTLGMSGQLTSTLATGTSPLSVTSTTVNTNLNADLLDGNHYSSSWPNASNTVLGSGTANYLSKWTGTYSQGNSIIYDNGTNVGIGTTGPSGILHLNGNGLQQVCFDAYSDTSTYRPVYNIRKSRGSYGSGTTTQNADFLGSLEFRGSYGTAFTTYGAASINAVQEGTCTDVNTIGGALAFSTNANAGGNATERMRITSGGNVGIGTTSPSALLQLEQSGATSTYKEQLRLSLKSTYSDSSSGIDWYDYNNTWNTGRISLIRQSAAASYDMAFYTMKDTVLSEAMRIDDGGNVGIGTASPSYPLHVVGDIYSSGCVISDGACADFVFDNTYKLPKLDELSDYITENKHLPGMTINEGGKISHNKAIYELLVKVEEQSRYILELHERIKKLEGE